MKPHLNPPPHKTTHPPTQNLPSIAEGQEHATFANIEEVELQQATNINASIAATRSSQTVESINST
jgi:hypothetical protein